MQTTGAVPTISSIVDVEVRRVGPVPAGTEPTRERLAAEQPLEVRIAGRAATVFLRTPGHDAELIRGFLFGEGAIRAAADIRAILPLADSVGSLAGSVWKVELAPSAPPAPLERSLYSSSACGACGKSSLASLDIVAKPCASALSISRTVLRVLPGRLRDAQAVFQETGGLHASGLFSPDGELVALREDVGRHNALDKLIGWALAAGRLPLDRQVLLLSGRVSYELMQKSIAAGVPVVAAVGAPSSLAVSLAERFGVTLVGFLRPDAFNIYTHGHRISDD